MDFSAFFWDQTQLFEEFTFSVLQHSKVLILEQEVCLGNFTFNPERPYTQWENEN